jgi:regulation of enolase protein 1 (concanavalin A-like superfamily)
MGEIGIDERFGGQRKVDLRLQWWNPPARSDVIDSRLVVTARANTDFWQRTHYDSRIDNGHCLFCDWGEGDFVLSTRVHLHPVHQFDQAGLMVRLSSACWLKTSVEYQSHGPNSLGAVVTNGGWSDWSIQPVSRDIAAIGLRVRREGADYLVDCDLASSPGATAPWSTLRIAHLAEDRANTLVQRGLYACSPKGGGCIAEFDYLKIELGRIGESIVEAKDH